MSSTALAHHLDFTSFPLAFKQRFFALCGFGVALYFLAPPGAALRRLAGFGAGSLAVAAVGRGESRWGLGWWPTMEASLLRFYWFRLSDIAVPIVVALLIGAWIDESLRRQPRQGRALLGLAAFLAALHFIPFVPLRCTPIPPRAFRVHEGQWRNQREQVADFLDWINVCAWINDPQHVPHDARFVTPMMCQTFKWYAGRAEVAVLKELPQNAASIVNWWKAARRPVTPWGTGDEGRRWSRSLTELPPERLAETGARYEADYLLTSREPPLPFEKVYANRRYVVYRLPQTRRAMNRRLPELLAARLAEPLPGPIVGSRFEPHPPHGRHYDRPSDGRPAGGRAAATLSARRPLVAPADAPPPGDCPRTPAR